MSIIFSSVIVRNLSICRTGSCTPLPATLSVTARHTALQYFMFILLCLCPLPRLVCSCPGRNVSEPHQLSARPHLCFLDTGLLPFLLVLLLCSGTSATCSPFRRTQFMGSWSYSLARDHSKHCAIGRCQIRHRLRATTT